MERVYNRDWNKLYNQYKKSGLSLSAFVEQENIPLSSASRRFRKISKSEQMQASDDQDVVFTPIEVISHVEPKSLETKIKQSHLALSIDKFEIRIPDDFNENTLRRVIGILGDIC